MRLHTIVSVRIQLTTTAHFVFAYIFAHFPGGVQYGVLFDGYEIKGYSGKYLVSNKGRIKSLKHRNAKLLTAFANNKGYSRVALCKDG